MQGSQELIMILRAQ